MTSRKLVASAAEAIADLEDGLLAVVSGTVVAGAAGAAGPAAGAVAAAIADLWPDLGGPDRWLRSAARVALERQPLASWRERARAERDPLARGEALLAWMRVADAAERPDVVRAVLAGEPTAGEAETLLVLRVLAIALARGTDMASADLERLQGLVDRVDRQFGGPLDSRLGGQPAAAVQREIVELLVAARCHHAVERLLDRLDRADSQEDQIHCVHALARWAGPWNVAEHRRLLAWFTRARNFRGGHLLPKILARMQEDVLRTVGDEERPALAAELAALDAPADAPAVSAAPPRPLVRAWTAADLEPELSRALAPRDAAAGRRALAAASCLACHRFGGAGSAVGPDLSAVGRRFDLRTLVASILEPSQVVDPKYHGTTWVLASGRSLTGRAAQVNAQEITIEVDPLTGRMEKVPRDEIESAHPSAVSPMPAGLVDVLTLDEILDLLALLRAGAG